ncbi:hypothetical protein Tco_1341301 [Tanacetum coccineum]
MFTNPCYNATTDRHMRAECSKDESLDSAKRSDDNTHSSAKEPSPRQSEGSSISELCGRVFFDILKSNRYSELCGLLLKNFGVVNANQVLDLNNGDYETSPMLYLKDTQLTRHVISFSAETSQEKLFAICRTYIDICMIRLKNLYLKDDPLNY